MHARNVANLKSSFDAELSSVTAGAAIRDAGVQAEREAAVSAHKNALGALQLAAISQNEMTETHAAHSVAMSSEHEATLRVQEAHASRALLETTSSLSAEHTIAVAKLEADAQLSSARLAHERDITELRAEQQRESHEAAVHALEARAQVQRDQDAIRLRQEHQAALAEMTGSHITELHGLREGEAVMVAEHKTVLKNIELQTEAHAELAAEQMAKEIASAALRSEQVPSAHVVAESTLRSQP